MTEILRTESAQAVAGGGTPILRTACASVGVPKCGYDLAQVTYVANKGKAPVVYGAGDVGMSFSPERVLVCADASALKSIGSSIWNDDQGVRMYRRAVAVSRLPVNTHLVVLTRALAARFWAPKPTTSWRQWAEWMGVGHLDTESALVHLYDLVRCGRPDAVPALNDTDLSFLTRTTGDDYYKLNSLSETWMYQLRTDPLGHREFLESGDVIKLRDPVHRGGKINFRIDGPCKVRENGTATLFTPFGIDAPSATVQLPDPPLYKPDGAMHWSVSFTAKNAKAWDLLSYLPQLLLTNAMLSAWRKTFNRRWNRNNSAPGSLPSRPVPMHVTLAAIAPHS